MKTVLVMMVVMMVMMMMMMVMMMMMMMTMSKHVTGVASGRTLDLFIPLMMERPTFHDDDDDYRYMNY